MSFHQFLQSDYLARPFAEDPVPALGNTAAYGVRLARATVPANQPGWRVLGVHHLTPEENRGNHVIYVDIVDEAGKPLRDPNLHLKWGWEGQRADEKVAPKRFDKSLNEPATNVDVYSGQNIWICVEGDGLPSDTVANLHTKHDDEPGPSGQLWNSIGHHSFYVLFQRTTSDGTAPPKPVEPGSGRKEPRLNVITFDTFSHQDLINAAAAASATLGSDDLWALLTRAGLDVADLAQTRLARYQGLPLHELPGLSNREKNALMLALAHVLTTMPVPPIDPTETDPVVPDPVQPPSPPETPPAYGNKLGFYLHLSIDQDGLWNAVQRVQPPVILVHSDTANKMLLQEIRRYRAPDAFVIGRIYKDNDTQRRMIDNDNPEDHGRAMADEILAYDFGLAKQRGDNGRLLIDAWMSLNEAVPGPASRQFGEKPQETSHLLANYDRFQAAFHQRLSEAGLEAIAFNFGAGNFGTADHYLDHFPRTLSAYTYLGFHEYGWPTMYPDAESATSAGTYRQCMEGIRARYGDQHRVIITEAGLTRMYKDPKLGDKGWLNDEAPLSEDQYWQSLNWYNSQMLADDYVMGACLYEVGHHGDWRTFRHMGKDNQGNDIRLMDRIVALKEARPRSALPAAMAAPAPTSLPITVGGLVTLHGFNMAGASVRLAGDQETVGAMPGAMLDAPGYVTWSRAVDGVDGRLWDLWVREVAQQTAGINWSEFKTRFAAYNPGFDGTLDTGQRYYLPENWVAQEGLGAVSVVWDRSLSGFAGSLWDCWVRYVQNKVVGLTYDQFKAQAANHNPALQGETQLERDERYNLPRNEGHRRYALQTYTSARGRFVFDELPVGSYELQVTAPGADPYASAFSVEADLQLDVKLMPTASLPAYSPGLAPLAMARSARSHEFVQVANREFVERGQSFRFTGVNIRGLVHYGDKRTLQHSQPGHQEEQLRAAYDMGARVVRVFLASMHADAGETINRLHRVVKIVSERYPGLYILPCFANLYADVPFRIPGDEGFYGRIDPNWNGDLLSADFFRSGYEQHYLPFVRQLVEAFRYEPAIFGWEVGNELKLNPQGHTSIDDPHLNAFVRFMQRAAQEIRSLDANHLITSGLISTHHCWMHGEALQREFYGRGDFDFLTVHCYNREYWNDDSNLAAMLNMPYIVEEAGFDTGFAGGDRARLIREDMDRWFNNGAGGYMQWGFMATGQDMGDGDDMSGMDKVLRGHNDWDALYRVYQERANHLAGQRRQMGVPPKKVRPSKPVDLENGATVYTQTMVNVRKSPGYVNKGDQDVLGQLATGASATIIGGSQTVDELVWWRISATLADGRTVEAWAAQSIPGQVLISTAIPAPMAPMAMPRGWRMAVVG